MCQTMTRGQWRTTRGGGTFAGEVVRLAVSLFAGESDCILPLHDALLDAGHEELALHFADLDETHKGKSPGPGQCWALLLILGRLPRGRELIGTPTASEWLGISPSRFRRLMERLNIQPADHYRNGHYKTGPLCPLWAPGDIAAITAEQIAPVKKGRSKKVG